MSSSSESDAPETITLKNAKSQSKKQNKELEERQMLTARLKKEKNQARDARLKAESAEKKRFSNAQVEISTERLGNRKGKDTERPMDVEDERTRLEKRMERAMAAAEEEDGSEGTDDDEADVSMEEDDARSTGEEGSEGGDSGDDGAAPSLNPDYLPEHYFDQIASSSKASASLERPKSVAPKRKRRPKNRKRQEEKVIGARAIRKLSSSLLPAAGRTTPSIKAKRFLHRQLKGDIGTKGWERRPVAIGSLASRTKPAARFVRG